MTDESLYSRLGGYDVVATVVEDFTAASVNDSQLRKYFENLSDDSCKKVQQLTVDFICKAAGGPVCYLGRDMNTAHKGMSIDETDWNRAVELLTNMLDKFNCPTQEREELCACVLLLKDEIVE